MGVVTVSDHGCRPWKSLSSQHFRMRHFEESWLPVWKSLPMTTRRSVTPSLMPMHIWIYQPLWYKALTTLGISLSVGNHLALLRVKDFQQCDVLEISYRNLAHTQLCYGT